LIRYIDTIAPDSTNWVGSNKF